MPVPQPIAFDAADTAQVALWDELPLWSALAGELLLEHVPMDARRVLDLGCGTGFPGLELSERLGPAAFVVGVDPWRAALERAHAKSRTWPAPRFAAVLGDGARLPLRDASVEMVVSNLGVNNFADPPAAFAECRRVLVRGGHVVLSTNLVGHFHELYEAFADVLVRAEDHAALERLRAHVAHRATVDGLTEALEPHGFVVAATHTREVAWRFRDGAALLGHHFIRLGFLSAWYEIAGEQAEAHLGALVRALDERARAAGVLALHVPLAVLVARAR